MNYHNYSEIFGYVNNYNVDTITSLSKHNQSYKNTYLYKRLPLKIHHKNIKHFTYKNYKLIVHDINTLVELNEIIKYNLNIIGIVFSDNFNSYIDKKHLPNTLQYIIFGSEFNQIIDNLPQSLKFIKFGWFFSRPLNNVSHSLRYIVVGYCFKNFLPNYVPTYKIWHTPLCRMRQNIPTINFH